MAQFTAKRYQAALVDLEPLVYRETPYYPAVSLLSGVYRALGEVTRAEKLIEDTLKRLAEDPNVGTDAARAELLCEKATVFAAEKNHEKARAFLEEAVKLSPTDNIILKNLACYNPRVSSRSRVFEMEVRGGPSEELILRNFRTKIHDDKIVFVGRYQVAAKSPDQGLRYIKRIVRYSDPETLKIAEAVRNKSAIGVKNEGVIKIFPSYSFSPSQGEAEEFSESEKVRNRFCNYSNSSEKLH